MKLYALVLEYGDYDQFVQGVFTDKDRALQEARDHSAQWKDVVHVVAFEDGSMVASLTDEVIAIYGEE